MKQIKIQLYTKVLIGMVLGVVVGILANRLGHPDPILVYVKPFGTLFIKLIRMVVIPLVFASLVVGTASLDDIRQLGRIGIKTLAFYTCTTIIAIFGGLMLAHVFQPGTGLPEKARLQILEQSQESHDAGTTSLAQKRPLAEVLLDIVPGNPVRAFVDGNILQVIFFACLFGICLTLLPKTQSQPVIDFFQGINAAMIQIMRVVMHAAPLGVFALMASVCAGFGASILVILLKYAMVVMGGLVAHMILVYSLAVSWLSPVSVRRFFTGIRPAQLIAFSSSSSSATLPVTLECAKDGLGVSSQISSFVLPLGATINMDGTALFQGVSAIFIAQVYGIDLSLVQQLTIVATATLASVGTAGTPGAGIVMLAMILDSAGLPLEGIALILGVERILDMLRSVVNITGDACCAVVVASSEKQLQGTSEP